MIPGIDQHIKFSDLCKLFEDVRKLRGQEKSDVFSDFVKDYQAQALKLKSEHPNAFISFYPALRLLLPQLERVRGPYGLKQHTLAKRLIKILCLPPQGADAQRLLNFNIIGSCKITDFADAAYWVLRKHFSCSSDLNLNKVNQYLDGMAKSHAENDPRGVDELLHDLLKKTSPEEQRWLIRIILKDLKLGMGQDRILKLFHPDALKFYSTNNSIMKVCDTLVDRSVHLHEIELSVFLPFCPMLSQRCDVAQLKKLFSGNPKLYIEVKFDGERFQLHMENNQFKYFSRNGFDYSNTYGTDFTSGVYTPRLKAAFKPHVKRIILDGEMMGWNTKTKKFGSKGMEFDVKHVKADSVYQPCFCAFDILLLNDETLSNKPLRERLLILDTVFTPVQGVIVTSHRIETSSRQEIIDALNKSMDREEEGIVFKDVMSVYKPNDRNAGWWKMKLEYFENVMSDLDVIVMGGYYGEGRNRNRITGFLVGVAIPPIDDGGLTPCGYLSFAKISSGLSDNELRIIDEKLGPHWKKLNEGDPKDHGLHWGKDKPDVWIPPNKSCVLLVRGSELIRIHSLDFRTDYTLRFPRIQKIRLDKPYYDCLTITELQGLTGGSKPVQKLSKRHLELEDLEVPEKEKRIRRRYLNVEMEPVQQTSELLSGYQFYVLTGTQNWKKDDVETMIRENGGNIVKIEGSETLCILVGEDHPRVNSCKQFDAPYDLVKLEWLHDVLDIKEFKMYSPLHMLHTSKKTRERFQVEYDKYGDSYLEDATMESLEKVMETIQKSIEYIHPMPTEIENLNQQLNITNLLDDFKNDVAYFDKSTQHTRDAQIEEEEFAFKFRGGIISNDLNENVTLVVMDTNNVNRKTNLLKQLSQVNNTKAKVVDRSFITPLN